MRVDGAIKTVYVESTNAAPAQIGGDIPSDKVRKIIGMVISQASGAAERILLYLGETGTLTSTTIAKMDIPDANAQEYGKNDRDKPLFVLRPQKAAGGTVSQNIFGVQDTAARVDLTVTYVDEIE